MNTLRSNHPFDKIRRLIAGAPITAIDPRAEQRRRQERSAAEHPAYQYGLDLGRTLWG